MKTLDDLDVEAEDLARALSLTRIAIGSLAFIAPRKLARAWTGRRGEDVPGNMAMRGLGIRDVALGLGTLMALERGRGARGWLEACALSDAGDVVSTLANFGELPVLKRISALASAGTGAYLGIALAEALDD